MKTWYDQEKGCLKSWDVEESKVIEVIVIKVEIKNYSKLIYHHSIVATVLGIHLIRQDS